MSQEVRAALPVLAPAAAIAAALMLPAWKPWRSAPMVANGHWAAPIALALGFCAAFLILTAWRGATLTDRWHWLAPIALAAAVSGLIAALRSSRGRIDTIIVMIMAAAVAMLLHPPPLVAHPALWQAAFALMVFIHWAHLEPLSRRRPGLAIPLAMLVAFSGLSVVMLMAHLAGFSLLAAAVAVVCGVAVAIAFANPHFTFARGGLHVLITLLIALTLSGWFYDSSRVTNWPGGIILASPALWWIFEWPAVQRRQRWQAVLIQLTIAAIPVLMALMLALRSREN